MKKPKPAAPKNLMVIFALCLVFAVVVVFQNCSQNSSTFTWQSKLSTDSSTNGNGGTYDGKPEVGIYYRIIPDYRCGQEAALFGHVEVAVEKATLRQLDPSTCRPVDTELALEQLEHSAFNRRLIGFSDGTFERRLAPPDPTDRSIVLPEVWCRADSSTAQYALEAVVRLAPSSGKIEPFVVRGSIDSSGRVSASEVTVTNSARRVSGQELEYSGDDFSLTLDLSGGANAFKVPARVQARLGSETVNEVMTCRRGGYLDVQAPLPPLSCPVNFVRVPALAGYAESDFCIAKFEAKVAGNVAVSQPQGLPWTQVDRAGALAACEANGLGYDLVSNNEWMATARNMELVAWNWSGSAGSLNTGHSDNVPQRTIEASANDNQACFGTGQTCDLSTWHSQRRVHRLSTGEVVWDMAGNATEWVKDSTSGSHGTTEYYVSALTDASNGAAQTKRVFGPAGDYTTLNVPPYGGLGYADIIGGNIGTILRGGMYTLNDKAGLFAFSTQVQPYSTDPGWGFRCVFRP